MRDNRQAVERLGKPGRGNRSARLLEEACRRIGQRGCTTQQTAQNCCGNNGPQGLSGAVTESAPWLLGAAEDRRPRNAAAMAAARG